MHEQLTETIEENWPIKKLALRCEACGETLVNRDYEELTIQTPSYAARLLIAFMRRHGWNGDVADHAPRYAVDITPPIDVDCEITVGPVG